LSELEHIGDFGKYWRNENRRRKIRRYFNRVFGIVKVYPLIDFSKQVSQNHCEDLGEEEFEEEEHY
jgi:hypothetical protein